MPTLDTTVTVSTTKDIKLKPTLRMKLLKALRTYGELRSQRKVIELAMDKHKAVISDLRDETGEQSLSLEGYTTTLVAPIRKKFNARKFVSLGGDIAIYNQAMDDVPSRAYEKITVPGSKDDYEG